MCNESAAWHASMPQQHAYQTATSSSNYNQHARHTPLPAHHEAHHAHTGSGTCRAHHLSTSAPTTILHNFYFIVSPEGGRLRSGTSDQRRWTRTYANILILRSTPTHTPNHASSTGVPSRRAHYTIPAQNPYPTYIFETTQFRAVRVWSTGQRVIKPRPV